MEEKNFKTAFSGFNKQEVLSYIGSVKSENAKTVDELNIKITELEETVAKQYDSIKEKNDQIASLMEELEIAHKENGNNFNRISQMTTENNELMSNFSAKEKEYETRIATLNEELENLRKSYEEEKSLSSKELNEKQDLEHRLALLEDRHKSTVDDYEIQFKSLKNSYDEKINQLTSENAAKITSLKETHQNELNSINNEYSIKVSQLEHDNQKAYEIARAGAADIKASLDSARAMEEDAKRRADAIIENAKVQCEQMKEAAEAEIAALRNEEMQAMESELDTRKNETYSKLRDISQNLERSRDEFAREFDSLTRSLRENI